MFLDLLTNACIAFTGLYLISKVINNSMTQLHLKKIIIGVLSGILGIFLIEKGFTYQEFIRIDFRYLALVVLGFYRLKSPLFVAAAIISVFRFSYGVNFQSIVACCAIFMIAIGFLVIYNLQFLKGKILLTGTCLNVWAISVAALTIFVNSGFQKESLIIVFMVAVISASVGVLMIILNLDVHIMNRRISEYKRSSETDHLTGLMNKRAWEEALERIEGYDRRYNVLILDIDHFKRINDTYGHVNGDEILRQFSDLIVRETRDHDLKARIGGEEFGILIPDLNSTSVLLVAERIRKSVSEHKFQLNTRLTIQVSVSIGIANGNASGIDAMVLQADQSLYVAKRSGRNRIHIDHSCIEELELN